MMFKSLMCLVVSIFLTSTQGRELSFGDLTNPLMSEFGPRTESNDVRSCYIGTVIDGAKNVQILPCFAPNSVCMTLSAMATIGGLSGKISSYSCGIASFCSPLGEASLCEEAKAKSKYPLTNCKVRCCRANNCNVPHQGGVKSEKEKDLSFGLPFEGRQF